MISSCRQESSLGSSFETGVKSLYGYLRFNVFLFLNIEDHESLRKVNKFFHGCIKEFISGDFPNSIDFGCFKQR